MMNTDLTGISQETKIPWQNRIMTRSLILFMAISLLPLLLVSAVTTYYIGRDARHEAENALVMSAADLTARLEGYFTILTRDMRFIAINFDRKNIHSKDNIRFLTAFAVEHPDIRTIWTADNGGRRDILYSRDEMLNKTAPAMKIPPLSGQTAGTIVWHPTRYNEFGEAIITASLPIVASWEDRAAGTLFFEIRPQDIHKLLEGLAMGGEVSAFLVDESGHLVSHSDRNIVAAGHDMFSTRPEIKQLRHDHADDLKSHLVHYTDADGRHVLAVYHHVPLTQWGVVVERSESEVYRTRNQLVRLAIGGFIGVILLVIPLAVLFSFRLTTPLARLSRATKALALGDLSSRSNVTSRDEIGMLADIFNQMADYRQKSEETLAQERERLFVTLHSVGDGIIATDINGRVVIINKVAEALTGWTRNEAVGRPLREVFTIINETTRMPCENPVEKVLTSGAIIGLANHTVLIARDGIERAVDDSGAPIRDRDNRIIGVILVFRDVTERRQMEQALRETKELFSLFMRHSPIYVYIKEVTSSESRVLQASENFHQMIGVAGSDMAGKTMSELFPPEFAAKITADDQAVVSRGEVLKLEEELNGRTYTTIKFPLVQGDRTLLAGYTIDTTDRRNLEAQLRQSQKMESIGTLAGGIAHDFNNILTAIIGYGNIALRKMAKEDPQRLNIEHMLDASDWAAHLTKDLLLFSRKQISERKPTDLNDIIQRVEKFLKRVIGEDVECRTTLAAGALPVLGDAHQLEQVLMNLASNARDAMPKGGIFSIATGQVKFDEEFISTHGYGTPGAYVVTTISDTGRGMGAATREHIFEPFFTTKEVGKGTGLGLAVVYGIIKQHDGFINVYSEPGVGTTFKVYLPLIAAQASEIKPAAEECPVGGMETILLAEDDEMVRDLTKTVLAEYGYQVITANDGREAVDKYRQNRDKVQLLLFDVIMPNKTGKEAYDEIRKIKPDIKILFMSGYARDMISGKELLDDKAAVTQKPISPMVLLKKVREELDRI